MSYGLSLQLQGLKSQINKKKHMTDKMEEDALIGVKIFNKLQNFEDG